MRDDVWMPHELVFVLDLYLRCGDLHRGCAEVIDASEVLRAIGLAAGSRSDSYRSPSSVASKLANFKSLDPRVVGGRPNAGDRDRLIWRKFSERPEERSRIAAAIRELAEGLQ